MNINLIVVLGILLWHWLADFVFQTDWQAQNKSSNWEALLTHTGVYSISWLVPICIYGIITNCNTKIFFLVPITLLIHTATDYYTSRVNKILWDSKQVHQFFVSIGFDQFLHFTQLLLTYYLLK